MFCQQCGEKLATASRFCPSCGVEVINNHSQDEPNGNEENVIEGNSGVNLEKTTTTSSVETGAGLEVAPASEGSRDNEESTQIAESRQGIEKTSRSRILIPVLIPVLSFFLIGGGAAAYYLLESNANKEVLTLQKSAEEAALNGEYGKAEKQLTRALNKRPHYVVLEQNLEAIQRADHYMSELTSIDEKIKEHNYSEAESDLFSLKEKVEEEVDPIFHPFAELLANREVTVTVGKVKQELDELTTVAELADKLNKIVALSTEESTEISDQIVTKIVQITSENADKHLENKRFSDAISTVEEGLQFAINNEKLLSYKEKIEQEQLAFEKAEQERIERAMEAAAEEDLQNRTAAVDVDFLDVNVDEYGDLYIYGEVINVATTEISSITINYTVYDLNGSYLYDGWTDVYPYYLSPGEKGSFEDVVYSVYDDVNVEIDEITWYLE